MTGPRGTSAASSSPLPAVSRHGPVAQLLIAWSPLSVILLAYAAADWVNRSIDVSRGGEVNRLGFRVHLAQPAGVDRQVFGAVPSVWLQQRLVDGSPHWYDAVAALVYATHFVAIPTVTALVWFRYRDRFLPWIAAVLTFTVVGIGGYVLYPAAPPWLASQQGLIGRVHRISDLGWGHVHLSAVGRLVGSGQDGSNPTAAFPSLHAGSALLVVLFLWPVATVPWRTTLLVYVALMALTLVYTGEHYVSDVAAGWLTATAAATVGAVIHAGRRRARADDHRRRDRVRSR